MTHGQQAEHSREQELSTLRARVAELEAYCARLRAEEQRHRMFVEVADEGLWAIDAREITIDANQKMASMLGTTIEKLLGASLFDCMDEHAVAECRALLERRRRGVGEQHEFEFVRRDGGRIRTRMRTLPMLDAGGVYQGAVAIVTDISELEATALELSRQKDDFHLIFDAAPAMIWFKDTQNRILRVNQCAAIARGLPVSEIEGRSTHEIFPAQADAYYANDLEVIRTNRPKLGVIESTTSASGEQRWIHIDIVPCRDERGQAVGVVVFALDITDAKRAEDALAASEKRYRDLVETSHDLIWSVDARGCWTFLNRAATLHIYGREPEELLGHA